MCHCHAWSAALLCLLQATAQLLPLHAPQPAATLPPAACLPVWVQSAANAGYFEVVLRLVRAGSPWRLKGDADVVKLLSKKSSYK